MRSRALAPQMSKPLEARFLTTSRAKPRQERRLRTRPAQKGMLRCQPRVSPSAARLAGPTSVRRQSFAAPSTRARRRFRRAHLTRPSAEMSASEAALHALELDEERFVGLLRNLIGESEHLQNTGVGTAYVPSGGPRDQALPRGARAAQEGKRGSARGGARHLRGGPRQPDHPVPGHGLGDGRPQFRRQSPRRRSREPGGVGCGSLQPHRGRR